MKIKHILLLIIPFGLIGSSSAQQGLRQDPTAFIENFRKSNGIEGCSVTVWNGSGSIIYSNGFGMAGPGNKYTPNTLCRVASVSKGISGIIAQTAVNEGKLKLDLPINSYLKYEKLGDPRIAQITTRMLLQHLSGFGTPNLSDPNTDNLFIIAPGTISPNLPLSNKDVVDWAMTKRTLFSDPGSAYAYSNLGYAVLVQVLEKATGQSYESYGRKVLSRLGAPKSFCGNTLRSVEGETAYYDRGNRTGIAEYGAPAGALPVPYGGAFVLENMQAGGGWVSSSNELARMMINTFSKQNTGDLLTKPAVTLPDSYTGLGWVVSGGSVSHAGSFECSGACVIWLNNGIGFAATFNTATVNDKQTGGFGSMFLKKFTDWIFAPG